MSDKLFISAQQLLEDSVELAKRILLSDFRPNYMVGVWRGGTPVGIVVQELLDHFGIETDHISIRTSSYQGVGKRSNQVRVHGVSYLTRSMNPEDRLLIVDDVFDTGLSVQAIIEAIEKRSRANLPRDIRVATAYFKPARNRTDMLPDYYVHETDQWLVFPHELDGMTSDEIQQHKPYLVDALEEIGQMQSKSKQ